MKICLSENFLRAQLKIYLKSIDESIIKAKKVAFLFFKNLLHNEFNNE